jgi:hypothetical protein
LPPVEPGLYFVSFENRHFGTNINQKINY